MKELERDYQRKRKAIEKQFYQLTKSLKEELVNVLVDVELTIGQNKKSIKRVCNERREKARAIHSTAIENSKDILSELFQQVRDVTKIGFIVLNSC